MKVHVMIPYSLDKNLGKAYNEAMTLIGKDDWACLLDYDVQLLTPDTIEILHRYAELYPDALLTCSTNRVHPINTEQLYQKRLSENADMKYHILTAEALKLKGMSVTEITKHLSGFLMLLSKRMWEDVKFSEDGKCLGVDTDYFRKLKTANKKVLRMDNVYVWHAYRLINGVNDKKHLL